MKKATFSAGCFWGVEATFRKLEGVIDTRVGYTGGHTDNPSYKDVCNHSTDHAEAVEITYDPDIISYDQLLNQFWQCHNPTTLNRQGPDVGNQYRSAIFYHDAAQKDLALASKQAIDASGKLSNPVVTKISPLNTFWQAEEYHQQYYEKKGISQCPLSHKDK